LSALLTSGRPGRARHRCVNREPRSCQGCATKVGALGRKRAASVRRVFRKQQPRCDPATIRAGEYELRFKVLHAGTRSEGRIGSLFHNGVEVSDAVAGQTISAGDATFVFLGDARPHPWSVSGWAQQQPDNASTSTPQSKE
jgi:hypothetical protein